MKVEIIELIVKVNYNDLTGRKEAIKKAKKGVLSSSIISTSGFTPIASKLMKD